MILFAFLLGLAMGSIGTMIITQWFNNLVKRLKQDPNKREQPSQKDTP